MCNNGAPVIWLLSAVIAVRITLISSEFVGRLEGGCSLVAVGGCGSAA